MNVDDFLKTHGLGDAIGVHGHNRLYLPAVIGRIISITVTQITVQFSMADGTVFAQKFSRKNGLCVRNVVWGGNSRHTAACLCYPEEVVMIAEENRRFKRAEFAKLVESAAKEVFGARCNVLHEVRFLLDNGTKR